MTSPLAPAQNTRTRWPMIGQRIRCDSSYVFIGFPLALITFVLVVVGVSLSAGLLIIYLGFPVLLGTIRFLRTFADLERIRAGNVIGTPLRRPNYRRAPENAGWFRRLFTPLTDPQSWLDLVHPILGFPVSVVTWSVLVTWWSGMLGGLTYFGWYRFVPYDDGTRDLPELLGFSDSTSARVTFYTLVGFFFLFTLAPVMRGCALAQAHLARVLLSGMAEIQARIKDLELEKADAQAQTVTARAQTASAVSAEATALRRLERDIHDGPQQRLVRLAMDLGRAKHQLENDDAPAARETVSEAISQTRETLDELRALSRGIAPPILVDRGLIAAITALAGRSTVPVDLEAASLGRLASGVESAAYFVVAEALTNVAKHSQATECHISLHRTAKEILVRVSDNGVGGAHLAKGHGLAGLADRVSATGGRLLVDSHDGSDSLRDPGTVIIAELPL